MTNVQAQTMPNLNKYTPEEWVDILDVIDNRYKDPHLDAFMIDVMRPWTEVVSSIVDPHLSLPGMLASFAQTSLLGSLVLNRQNLL